MVAGNEGLCYTITNTNGRTLGWRLSCETKNQCIVKHTQSWRFRTLQVTRGRCTGKTPHLCIKWRVCFTIRRVGRAAEGTGLLNRHTGNCVVSSNLTLSAKCCSVRLSVRTPAFHAGKRSSILLQSASTIAG